MVQQSDAVDAVGEVVVGVDGSTEARTALVWGIQEARLRRLPVRLVTVVTEARPEEQGAQVPTVRDFEQDVEARMRADAADVAARTAASGVPVTTEIRYGHPAKSLIDAAGPDALLVVGSRGRGSVRGLLLGSVSQQCAQYAGGPVVVVRGDPPAAGNPGRVVVGVDGSRDSVDAAVFAAAAARLRGSELHVVHGWMDTVSGYGGPPWALPVTTLREAAEAALQNSLREAGLCEPSDLRVRAEAVEGVEWDILLDVAEGAELLVVGSRGRSGWSSLLLGSVSLHCVTGSPCPVAVVRPAERKR